MSVTYECTKNRKINQKLQGVLQQLFVSEFGMSEHWIRKELYIILKRKHARRCSYWSWILYRVATEETGRISYFIQIQDIY